MQAWSLFILYFHLMVVSGGKSDAHLRQVCETEIPSDYEIHKPPTNEDEPGQPLKVFVKFKVIDIDEIDGTNMEFRLHMYFRLFWKDPRLKREDNLTTDCSAYVWTPDVMFETAKNTETFDTVPTAFRIEKSGLIIMTDRYSFKANCIMHFRHYPFDKQECLFSVVFMTTRDDVALLRWLDDKSSPFPSKPIEFTRKIEPLQYLLEEPTTHLRTDKLSYANYTYLVAKFTLVRRLTGIIVTIYLPSTLVVAVSWVTFWLRPEAAPARVSLSITSLLTLCTQVQQYKALLPSVNYITAMDIWLFACIFVVFSTLLEFALSYNAYVIASDEEKYKMNLKGKEQPIPSSSSEGTKINSWTEEQKETSKLGARLKQSMYGQEKKMENTLLKNSLKMDAFCRKYYPTSFLVFVIVYWAYFMNVS